MISREKTLHGTRKWNEQIIIIPVNSIYSPLLGKENFGNFNNNIAQCCTMYYCILYISTIKHNGKTTAIFTHALLSNTSPNLIPRLLDHTAPRPPSPITPSPLTYPPPRPGCEFSSHQRHCSFLYLHYIQNIYFTCF